MGNNANNDKYIAFMAHLPPKHEEEPMLDYLETTLKEYDIQGYIIGEETEPYNHYHFIVQISEKDYHKFASRVFKKKYNLRGKAIKDHPRQYGKVKEIENVERMKAYTLKEGVFRTNLPGEDIAKLQFVAETKQVDIDFEDKICRNIMLKHNLKEKTNYEPSHIKIWAIEEMLKLKIKSVPTKGKINKITSLWYWKYAKQTSAEIMYEVIFNTKLIHFN